MDQSTVHTVSTQTSTQHLEKKPSYFKRLFSGRMNRQNYIIGSTLAAIPPSICFFIVTFNILLSPNTFALPSLDTVNPDKILMPELSFSNLVLTPANEFWIGLGVMFFILSLPYLFSMQLRRQHDLGMNGWWWVVNIVPLVELYTYLPNTRAFPGTIWWFGISFLSMLASLFSLYFTVWPGTPGPNKYGAPTIPRTSMKKDVLLWD